MIDLSPLGGSAIPADVAGPDNPSSDYAAMKPYWDMIAAILGGVATMRAAAEKYLPKFSGEENPEYNRRLEVAPFTNIYEDISSNLASKPFSAPLKLEGKPSADIAALADDIDALGNNIHNFAKETFQRGIDSAIDWILVDHTRVVRDDSARDLSVAEEKALGLRPYWVAIPADRMLAVYSDRVNGQEIFTHVRIAEPTVERVEFTEVTKSRIRVIERPLAADGSYGPPSYQIFEKQKDKTTGKLAWVSIEGPQVMSIPLITLVPFYTGKRLGTSWQFMPALRKVAELQIEEFQTESNLKNALVFTGFPMYAAQGVDLRGSDPNAAPVRMQVGPGRILEAPPDQNGNHGEWQILEPSSESTKTLMAHLESTQKNMRDLGMLPMTEANLTVITTANVSLKAHSIVQAWTLRLKDALEQAWKYTALWMGDVSKAPEVYVFQDFGVDFEAGNELDSLLKGQAQGVLSKQTVQEEFKRRNVLSDNFDVGEEKKRLAEDEEGLEPEQAIDPATGEPILPPMRPLVVSKPAGLPPQQMN